MLNELFAGIIKCSSILPQYFTKAIFIGLIASILMASVSYLFKHIISYLNFNLSDSFLINEIYFTQIL